MPADEPRDGARFARDLVIECLRRGDENAARTAMRERALIAYPLLPLRAPPVTSVIDPIASQFNAANGTLLIDGPPFRVGKGREG